MAVGIKKFTMEYLVPKIKVGSLKNRREDYDKIVKGVDSAMATGSSKVILSPEARAEIKKGVSTTLKKTSKLQDDIDKIKGTEKEYKAKGGRVGLKFGTTRKSNIQKIKEAFGVKKKEKPKERMMAKKGSKPKKKFPDLTGDGKVTFADILKGRGVINGKKKKKVI